MGGYLVMKTKGPYMAFNHIPKLGTIEGLTRGCRKKRSFRPGMNDQVWSRIAEVVFDGIDRRAPQKDQPLFGTLARTTTPSFLEIDVPELESTNLGSSATGGVKRFQKGSISEVVAMARVWRMKQAMDRFRA